MEDVTGLQAQIDSLHAKGDTITDFERIRLGRLRLAIVDANNRNAASEQLTATLTKPTETRLGPMTVGKSLGPATAVRVGELRTVKLGPITPAIKQ